MARLDTICLPIALVGLHHCPEYPADYAPPVMDPFVDDQVPFGVSSSLSCLKDSEHLEKAFDLLRYQHLSKKLGVPSALNQRTPIRRLRILGNSSSGSPFEFLAVAAKLAHFIQSGSREIYGGSKGSTRGEKNGMHTSGVVCV